MITYPEVLGLDHKATLSEIKAAYRHCVNLYHPDNNPTDPQAKEKLEVAKEAYYYSRKYGGLPYIDETETASLFINIKGWRYCRADCYRTKKGVWKPKFSANESLGFFRLLFFFPAYLIKAIFTLIDHVFVFVVYWTIRIIGYHIFGNKKGSENLIIKLSNLSAAIFIESIALKI